MKENNVYVQCIEVNVPPIVHFAVALVGHRSLLVEYIVINCGYLVSKKAKLYIKKR